jgi:hypothetical protein
VCLSDDNGGTPKCFAPSKAVHELDELQFDADI